MDPKDAIAISISIVALGFSIISFISSRRRERYKIGDDKLLDILKINLQYPEFDNAEFTSSYEAWPNKKLARQYEVYAMIIWNYLESLFDYYGRRGIKHTGFWGAFEYWSRLHYEWFSKRENYCAYPAPFMDFIKDLRAEMEKTESRSADQT